MRTTQQNDGNDWNASPDRLRGLVYEAMRAEARGDLVEWQRLIGLHHTLIIARDIRSKRGAA